jgi:hypothetical protein
MPTVKGASNVTITKWPSTTNAWLVRVAGADVGVECNLGLLDVVGDRLDRFFAPACLCPLHLRSSSGGLGLGSLALGGLGLSPCLNAFDVHDLAGALGLELRLAVGAAGATEGHQSPFHNAKSPITVITNAMLSAAQSLVRGAR